MKLKMYIYAEKLEYMNRLKYLCDNKRHLICLPYSISNLHRMAEDLGIPRYFYHKKGNNIHPHYDIPAKRLKEIQSKCRTISSKELLTIIKQQINMTEFKNKIESELEISSKIKECLKRIGTDENKLMIFIHNFVDYNIPFSSGAVNFIANLQLSKNFEKRKHDASAEIAGLIFESIIDDFIDGTENRMINKKMALEFRKNSYKILKQKEQSFEPINFSEQILYASSKRTYNEPACLGFHACSKLLAHKEFNIVNSYLKKNWPNLVDDLESILIKNRNAYSWIYLNSVYEEDNANLAFQACDLAKKYYNKPNFDLYLYEGAKDFLRVQEEIFTKILNLL